MIDDLKVWAVSVCCAMVVCSIVLLISPSKNLHKLLKTSLGVFFISTIISPFLLFNLNLDFNSFTDQFSQTNTQQSEYTKEYSELTRQTIEKTLKSQIHTTLNSINIQPKKISLEYTKNEQGSIIINKVKIFLDPKYALSQGEIETKLKEAIGSIETAIIY